MRKDAKRQMERFKRRSERMLHKLVRDIDKQKKELGIGGYYRTYSKGELTSELGISKRIAETTLNAMQESGIALHRDENKATRPYKLTIEDVAEFYHFRGEPKLRDQYDKAWVVFIGNLKGGISKTVSTVSIAHGMRTHPMLLKHDLRILVVDLDPQSSATMFLSHKHSVGLVETTGVQAILQDLPAEEIKEHFIIQTQVPGVDVLPASIDDGFTAALWEELCAEHLPGVNPDEALRDCLIKKLEGDYDFIFLDTGPHLDALLKQCVVAADMLVTPIAPAQVDFHSSLRYTSRIPDIVKMIENTGTEVRYHTNIPMMTKLANKKDQLVAYSQAKEVFGGDILDATFPRLDAMERCGETFDTVITIPPSNYDGSKDALKRASTSVYEVSLALFERIEFIRSEFQENA